MSNDRRLHAVPILSGSALVGSCVLSFFPDTAATPISAAGVAISSIILSYWMTQISEKKRFEEQKKEIGRLAIRRAQNLSDDLNDFADYICSHTVNTEVIDFWLKSKARDALTSLDDIRDMAGMTGIAGDASAKNPQTSMGSMPQEAVGELIDETSGDFDIPSNVNVNCVKCGTNNEVYLPMTPTSTRMFSCRNCEYRQNVHRLVGGGYKVSDPLKNATALPSIGCPSCGNSIPMPKVTNLAVPVRRICLQCTAPIEYSPIRESSTILEIPEQKQTLPGVEPSYSCQCGRSFEPKLLKDREGKDFFGCFNCLRVYYVSPTATVLASNT